MDNTEKTALILRNTSILVQKDLEVEGIPEEVSEQALLDFLERFIKDLLDNNMERLFYVLYRLDINEQKAHQALSPYSEEPPHQALAMLIYKREQQKATTRLEYSSYDYEEDDEVEKW